MAEENTFIFNLKKLKFTLVGVLIVLIILGARWWSTNHNQPTDEQMILAIIEKTKADAERKDAGAILQLMSDSFTAPGVTKKQLKVILNQSLKDVTNVVITNSPPVVTVNGDSAEARIARISARFEQAGTPETHELNDVKLQFQKEEHTKMFILHEHTWMYKNIDKLPAQIPQQ